MKFKKLSLLLISILSLSMSACGSNTNSKPESDKKVVESNSTNTAADSEAEDFSLSPWGSKLYSIFLKNYGMDLPFPTGALSVKYGETEDNYGDPMIVLLCSFEDADAIDTAVEQYAIDALEQGYNVAAMDYNNGHPAYDCSIPYNNSMTVHIQVLYGGADTDGDGEAEDYLGLFVTSEVSVDPYVWPSDLINYTLGFEVDIPALEGSGITYDSSEVHDEDFGNYTSIVVYGIETEDVLNYKTLLESNGYTVQYCIEYSETDESYDLTYYLAWIDDTFFIQFNSGTYLSQNYIDINICKGDVHKFFDVE